LLMYSISLCPFPPLRCRSKFCAKPTTWTHLRRSRTVQRLRSQPFGLVLSPIAAVLRLLVVESHPLPPIIPSSSSSFGASDVTVKATDAELTKWHRHKISVLHNYFNRYKTAITHLSDITDGTDADPPRHPISARRRRVGPRLLPDYFVRLPFFHVALIRTPHPATYPSSTC
jgi:hypothetical protein